LKDEWNKETFAQELFGINWGAGERVKKLKDFMPNFLWTYGKINDKGDVVNILSQCKLCLYICILSVLFAFTIQTEPFTSSQLSEAMRTIYLGGKKSKFKIGANGPPRLTDAMVALAAVVVSIID